MADVSPYKTLDRAPGDRYAAEREREPRIAVEGDLRPPGRGSAERERVRQLLGVAVEAHKEAHEQVGDRLRGEPGGDERLVHAVAGQRIDQPGCVADEEPPAARSNRSGAPQRQAMPAQALD